MEALAKLRPLFDRRDGTVTAGNSCQITDGAAALLVADSSAAHALEMNTLGFVRSYAYAALDPARMGLGPVYAINAAAQADWDEFVATSTFSRSTRRSRRRCWRASKR